MDTQKVAVCHTLMLIESITDLQGCMQTNPPSNLLPQQQELKYYKNNKSFNLFHH